VAAQGLNEAVVAEVEERQVEAAVAVVAEAVEAVPRLSLHLDGRTEESC
jgi:hypothetical protein